MKRIQCLFLVLIMLFSLSACNQQSFPNINEKKQKNNSTQIIEDSNKTNDEDIEENDSIIPEILEVSLPVNANEYTSLLSKRLMDISELSNITTPLTKSYTDYGDAMPGYGIFTYSYGTSHTTLCAYTYKDEVTQFEAKIQFGNSSSTNIDLVLLPATVFFSNSDTSTIINTIKNEMIVYNTSDELNGTLIDYWYTNGDLELLITVINWKTGYQKGTTSFIVLGEINGKQHAYQYSGWPTY